VPDLRKIAINQAEEEYRKIAATGFWEKFIKEIKISFDTSYKTLRTTREKHEYSQGELDAYEKVLGMPKTILDRLRRK